MQGRSGKMASCDLPHLWPYFGLVMGTRTLIYGLRPP
jgi:hypothetical protein